MPLICQASWEGHIAHEPRGDNGFGYDPLFVVDGMNQTSAELDPGTEKPAQPPGSGAARTAKSAAGEIVNTENVPLSLYVHLPWCVSKCPYCDFNSHALRSDLPEKMYLEALSRDLISAAADSVGRSVDSIFFGGGTPSLFSASSLARFLDVAASHLTLSDEAEVTLEANPGTIERGNFSAYRDAGINRVSLGAQSFLPQHLKALGRIHSVSETEAAVNELISAGIGNFNLDLMYGLPEQTVEQAVADVDAALAMEPAHLSHYQLTLEPNTLFARKPPSLPDDDTRWAMQCACQELIAGAGFEHYEVSAYAQPGKRCRHNLNYWQFGDYLGVGAGAHGKLSVEAGVRRDSRYRHPDRYMRSSNPVELTRWLEDDELVFEFMLNALRLESGFDLALFTATTGLELAQIESRIAQAVDRGFLVTDGSQCGLCENGRHFRDDLISIFLPDERSSAGREVV